MTGVKKTLAEQVEARFIRRCQVVTAVNDEIADWYAGHYRIARPLVVVNYPAKVTRGRPPVTCGANWGCVTTRCCSCTPVT